MQVRLLKIPDGAIRITERSEAPEGATIYEGDQGGLAYLPAGEDTGEEESKTDREQEIAEVAANAKPTELGGCLQAAVSPEDTGDFAVLKFRVASADTNAEAQSIIEEHLSEAEIDKLAEEVALQEQMRQDFDAIDSVQELQFGQEVLVDGAVPTRGIVDEVKSNTVFVKNALTDDVTGFGLENEDAIYADEQRRGPDLEPAEPGKYGLASSDQVLSQPFDYASKIRGSREAGITDGNTTGESMKVLTMEDGSKVFATPLDAYEHTTTGVVDNPTEARINNLNSPKLITALGGNACKTELVEGPGGNEYIAKEGVDGQMFEEYKPSGDVPESLRQTAAATMAAAYFVGNSDLHGANMKVNENDELSIIDHDNAGSYFLNGEEVIDDFRYYDTPLSGSNKEQLIQNARDIKSGKIDFSDIGNAHTDYAHKAANKALRVAAIDETYDLPPEETPEAMQLIDGFEDSDNWPESGESVLFVDDRGDIVEKEIKYSTAEGSGVTGGLFGGGVAIDEDNVNRIVEVL